MILTKAFLKDLLKTKTLNVKFKKRDGSERCMLCTLKEDYLPALKEPATPKKSENDDVLAVWDLDKNAFRSFRIDSVIEYKENL